MSVNRPPVLGTVERRVISAGFATLTFLAVWVFHQFDTSREAQGQAFAEQGKALASMATQQAVMNDRLGRLTTQLADVPGLTQRVAELQVRVERNTADISDIRGEKKR